MLRPNGQGPRDVDPATWEAETSKPLPLSAAEPDANRPTPSSVSPPNAAGPFCPPVPQALDAARSGMSIIGKDLTILGQGVRIVSKGPIRVDGVVQGDVLGTEVIVGHIGKVGGGVSARTVTVFGSIQGTIRGARVLLEAGAKVEGDVHHQTLSVHEGAQFEGRVRRARDLPELGPDATDSPTPN